MRERNGEKGEIMICCIILFIILMIFVLMAIACIASGSTTKTTNHVSSTERIAVEDPVVPSRSIEVVDKEEVNSKLPRGERLALITALITAIGSLACAAVVPGKILRVMMVILLLSLSMVLFLVLR